MSFIAFLLIGGLAGYIAADLLKSRGIARLKLIGLGIGGAIVGGILSSLWTFSLVDWLTDLFTALVGAVVILIIAKYYLGKKKRV
jgi:uncharacterized membrane protein YeaQ/YmgE (transglycosylase-associated protein family)